VNASTFEFRGFTRETYAERFHKEIPTTENGLINFDHQANLMCEWKRVYPETKFYLGVWNRPHTNCLALGDRAKPKCSKLYPLELVCVERPICVC
jgi:hypothetical protein